MKNKKKQTPLYYTIKVKSEYLLANGEAEQANAAEYLEQVFIAGLKSFNKMYKSRKALISFEQDGTDIIEGNIYSVFNCYVGSRALIKATAN